MESEYPGYEKIDINGSTIEKYLQNCGSQNYEVTNKSVKGMTRIMGGRRFFGNFGIELKDGKFLEGITLFQREGAIKGKYNVLDDSLNLDDDIIDVKEISALYRKSGR